MKNHALYRHVMFSKLSVSYNRVMLLMAHNVQNCTIFTFNFC